jgi:hypothetical protein
MSALPFAAAPARPASRPALVFYNSDAEEMLLQSLLSCPEALRELDVTAEDFGDRARTIFGAISRLHDRGEAVSTDAVAAELTRTGELEAAGGLGYVLSLGAIFSLPTAQHWFSVVRPLTRRRQAARLADQLRAGIQAGDDLTSLAGPIEELGALTRGDTLPEEARPLTPLTALEAGPPDPRATVLGERFLCLGGALLFVGPTGIGKSSASMQQDILWSLGREAFGIRPARPLHILTIQAENDAADLAEMRDGVIRGLDLSAEDCAAVGQRVFYETESERVGADFLRRVESRLRKGRFDLLRIDPLQAFLGGDPKETEVTANFLRAGLAPLLTRYEVACILNHHTPKTNHRDTSGWRGSDWMYAGAGSADITNWARATLVIDPTHTPHVFKFIAAKRGGRIGWRDEAGERETTRYFCHASEGLHWREATAADLDAMDNAAREAKGGHAVSSKTPADLKALIPKTGAVPKNDLVASAANAGIGRNKARLFIQELMTAGEAFQWFVPREGNRPEVHISLHEQSLFDKAP